MGHGVYGWGSTASAKCIRLAVLRLLIIPLALHICCLSSAEPRPLWVWSTEMYVVPSCDCRSLRQCGMTNSWLVWVRQRELCQPTGFPYGEPLLVCVVSDAHDQNSCGPSKRFWSLYGLLRIGSLSLSKWYALTKFHSLNPTTAISVISGNILSSGIIMVSTNQCYCLESTVSISGSSMLPNAIFPLKSAGKLIILLSRLPLNLPKSEIRFPLLKIHLSQVLKPLCSHSNLSKLGGLLSEETDSMQSNVSISFFV